MKLVSVTLLTRLRTDVCVHYTQAWMLLCVTQLQKCLQCCPMCTVCVCLSLPSSPFSLRAAADQIKWTVHQVSFASHSRCELSPESTAQSLSPFRCPLTVAVLATAPRLCSCRSREEEERLQSFGVKDGTGAVDTRGPGSNARSAVDNQW